MNIGSPAPSNHCHVALRAGFAGSGKPVFETLPARAVASGSYELTGSPGMVEGCAAGDLLKSTPTACSRLSAEARTFVSKHSASHPSTPSRWNPSPAPSFPWAAWWRRPPTGGSSW
ncbi:hypothetical protein GCM10010284_11810 [Streptomyces rubiginosohelvolus]|uniref:Uncharacterized protein n=1 Tax=Streptomyces rubiginosohelvolus TaxID=67362 RepID=A0ABQ3BQE2_9ACTN|nr:hypothetical protein GCM10010284_11810 [Streptomyces rubiginosohelvolus]GGZ53459.1 hypothetical protein GCM10010328_30340 [Streptomyces pluricolorescens]